MAFTKRNVTDRIIEYPGRYTMTTVSPGVVDLVPQTGNVVQEGTKINKAYLQPIENELENLSVPKYGIAAGTNAYIVTVPEVASLVIGMQMMVKFTNASTAGTSLNVNGLGVKALTKAGGGSPRIKAGGVYTLGYDGVNFQLLGEGGEYGTAIGGDVIVGKTIGTDEGLVSGTLALTGTATPSQVLNGYTYYGTDPKIKGYGTMINRADTLPYPLASNSSYGGGASYIMPPIGYYDGNTWTQIVEPNMVPQNVKSGVVFGIGLGGNLTGTFTGLGNAAVGDVLASKTFSTGTLSNSTGTMVNNGAYRANIATQYGNAYIPAGYHTGAGYVNATFPNLNAGNIKAGVTVGGVVGTLKENSIYKWGTLNTAGSVSISSLGFRPQTVIINVSDSNTTLQAIRSGTINSFVMSDKNDNYIGYAGSTVTSSNISVNSDGFTFSFSSVITGTTMNVYWQAFS